jgi:hypothetical protein
MHIPCTIRARPRAPARRNLRLSAGIDGRRSAEAAMTRELKKGDKVSWNTSQGETHGAVEKKQTRRTHIKGHTVAATPDEPQYIVRSDKSGKKAAHKPEELKRTS